MKTLTQKQLNDIDAILKTQAEKERGDVLNPLEEMKLYKLTFLEEPKSITLNDRISEVVQVKDEEGNKKALWLTTTVLKNKVSTYKPLKNKVLGIVNKGKPKDKNYYDYAVFEWSMEIAELLK